jgi:lipoprotein-anchoring transpeptidase ErfK/SrfK
MNRLLKTFAAATVLLAGFAGSAAQADVTNLYEGVIVVPASANPMQDDTSTIVRKAEKPAFKRAKIVKFETSMAAGSIIVDTSKNYLYYVIGGGKAGFEWTGSHEVTSKTVWPDWRPPAEMRARRPELPAFMAGGPDNPLGARAIYLGSSIYRIHGTNEPASIGKAASSGCIRMLNDDVVELYRFVKLGATVTVL